VRVLVPVLAAAAALAGGGWASARPLPEGPASSNVLIAVDPFTGPAGREILQTRGAELLSADLGVWRVRGATSATIVAQLEQLGALRHVAPDRRAMALDHLSRGDPLVADPWYLAAVGATRAEPPGPGRAVAVVDSGIDLRHEEFANRPDTEDLNEQAPFESDEDFHGTAVSSLVGAPANGVGLVGVYPQARLLSWDDHGTTLGGIVQGIDVSSAAGAAVINLSFGFTTTDPLLEQVVALAVRRGSLVVAAAGNDRERGSPAIFPARLPHVLTVGATDRRNRLAYFSSSSPGMDLAAPGLDVPVAVPRLFTRDDSGYDALSGTSFAAPLVVGAAAWVWTERPTLNNGQLFELLRTSARDLDPPGYDQATGYGLVNIPNALARSAPPRDAQEPNEDVALVKPRALFRTGNSPLTTATQRDATVRAQLMTTDDPRDVYRLWIPRNGTVSIRLTPERDVDVRIWGPRTVSVRERPSARARDLVGTRTSIGTKAETIRVRNSGAGGYFYVEAFLGQRTATARYTLSVATLR
jgi:subtilisin family serine protease